MGKQIKIGKRRNTLNLIFMPSHCTNHVKLKQTSSNLSCEYLPTSSKYLATSSKYLATSSEYLATPCEYLATPCEYLATPCEYLATPCEYERIAHYESLEDKTTKDYVLCEASVPLWIGG